MNEKEVIYKGALVGLLTATRQVEPVIDWSKLDPEAGDTWRMAVAEAKEVLDESPGSCEDGTCTLR